MADNQAHEGTVCMLSTLERHGYAKLTELIDGNHLAEARQVAAIMKEVGII